MRVLIAEDSRAMRQLYKEVLLTLGRLEIVEAEDGVDAARKLDKYNFQVDLILVDWIMPRMDGLSFVRQLKQNQNLRHIPVLMVTSCSDEKMMRKAWDAGVDGYLLKPFTQELLLQAIVSLSPRYEARVSPPKAEDSKIVGETFLDELPPDLKRRILAMTVYGPVDKDVTLLQQGKTVDYFYFVIRGRVEEHQHTVSCSGALLRTYGPGECFGVTELMAGDPLRSNFRTAEPSEIGRVPKEAFEGMLVKFPAIGVTLSRYLASKARQMQLTVGAEESSLLGKLEILDLPALVQAVNLRQKTCVIELSEIDSQIVFVRGEVIAARHGQQRGEEAFFGIMERRPSNFRLVTQSGTVSRNVYLGTTRLLLECARRIDETSVAARCY